MYIDEDGDVGMCSIIL